MWIDIVEAVGAYYIWIKALHVISVIAWMAGLLYLPRLFVYHSGVEAGSEASEVFKDMERRLLRAIMAPASIAVWVFGLVLAGIPGVVDWTNRWWLIKAAVVLAITWYHHSLARWWKEFVADRNTRPAKFYRVASEVPTVLMIIIVIMVIVRPF